MDHRLADDANPHIGRAPIKFAALAIILRRRADSNGVECLRYFAIARDMVAIPIHFVA